MEITCRTSQNNVSAGNSRKLTPEKSENSHSRKSIPANYLKFGKKGIKMPKQRSEFAKINSAKCPKSVFAKINSCERSKIWPKRFINDKQ